MARNVSDSGVPGPRSERGRSGIIAANSCEPLSIGGGLWPPTLIVVHPKERRAKCSVEPLRGRADLRFLEYSPQQSLELPQYLRLAVDGPALCAADAAMGLLLIDGTWRHAAKMHEHFAQVPPRSLTGFCTAYPRLSKLFQDPAQGLASVEALYIAYRTLNRPTTGLLDGYHWRDLFLQLNGWA